jgi:hypothetical protein
MATQSLPLNFAVDGTVEPLVLTYGVVWRGVVKLVVKESATDPGHAVNTSCPPPGRDQCYFVIPTHGKVPYDLIAYNSSGAVLASGRDKLEAMN